MATYLVTQATGQQSVWVITHLLAAGLKVNAVVRDPSKTLPPILSQPGVKVFKGDSTDLNSIYQAAQGCKGAFLNTFLAPGVETLQAKTIVEACKKAGVETVVASTTFGTGNRDVWDDEVTRACGLYEYYISKTSVEDAVRAGGFKSYTILRGGFMHFDYLLPSVNQNFPEFPTTGELRHPANEGTRLPHTDASDLGKYVVAAFQDMEKFNGQEIDLVNENLTIEEARDIIEKVSGRKVKLVKRSSEEFKEMLSSAGGQLFPHWANHKEFGSLVAAARENPIKFGIPLTSLEATLTREKNRLLEAFPA